MPLPNPEAVRHTLLEDIQGLGLGVFICSVGITILAHLGFVTGQTAGLALLISYAAVWSFGYVFFLVNLPFYYVAWRRLGTVFTVKSAICVTTVSVAVETMPIGFELGTINPLLGTAIFGALAGLGLLAVFRHGGSLGGLGVVALIVQDRTGFKAGYVQLLVDTVLFATALLIFPWTVVAYSLFGAVILNGVIAFNHRRDRYIAPT